MNKFSARILFTLLVFICVANVQAYVINRTSADSLVHWPSGISALSIFLNTNNSQGLSSGNINSITTNSVAQWNSKSRISISKNTTSGTNQSSINEIYFSSDPSVFNGTGVVGVTLVSFKNGNGEILEADILLNDTFSFTTDVNEVNYLGNVITHEMGHFLGLGHGQVAGSTMLFALSRGQNQVADDDAAGVYSLYPTGSATKSSLTGKIVGGNNLVGVFGAHVQAISMTTGRVGGAAISDTDGSFAIHGLSRNDKYYIYNSPIAQIGLPSKYSSVKSDFCASSRKYRGSFFQSCGSSFEGHPQSVLMNSSSVAVGKITIRCGLDVPTDYIQSKNTTPAVFDIQNNVISGIGNTFTGYFSLQELSLNQVDYFRMDYSAIDWDALFPSGDLYVELKVINQPFYSPMKAVVGVKSNSLNYSISPHYIIEPDGAINIDTVTRIPINRDDLSDNNFEISVTPKQIETASVTLPYVKTDYFPSSGYFEDSLSFYLVTATIVRDNGDSTFTVVSSKNDQLSDNTQCTDANNTYALTNYAIKGASLSKAKRGEDNGVACGTVDMSGNSGNGPGGFFIGLIFSLFLCSLTSSIIRNNKPI